MTVFDQALECIPVQRQSIVLKRNVVPPKSMSIECIQYRIGRAASAARSIQVLDSEQPSSAVRTRMNEAGYRRQ